MFDDFSLQDTQVFVRFRVFLSSLYLVVPFCQLDIVCYISLQACRIFLCQIPFMPWLYIVTARIREANSFLVFAIRLMSSMYIRWLIFSCDLLSLYPLVHFPSKCLSGIIAILNGNWDSTSPWKIPLWIFASAKILPYDVYFILQIFLVFSIRFNTSSDICIFWGSLLSSFARP